MRDQPRLIRPALAEMLDAGLNQATFGHRSACPAPALLLASMIVFALACLPAAGECPGDISGGSLIIDGANGRVGLPVTYSYTSGSIILSTVYLYWPSSNGNLINATLDDNVVYATVTTPPSQLFAAAGTTEAESIYCGQTKTLWFNFQNAVQILGNSNAEASADSNLAGMAEAFSYTATSSGTATILNLYLDATNTAANIIVGVYANSGTHPGTLLSTGSLTNPVAGAWNRISIDPVDITSGTTYWLVVLSPSGDPGTIKFLDNASGSHSETSQETDLASLPGSWSTGSAYTTGMMSAYLTTQSSLDTDPSAYRIRLRFGCGSYAGYPSLPSCSIVGPDTVCDAVSYWHNASATDEIAPFTYTYSWNVDLGGSLGSAKNFKVDWAPYADGPHTLYVTQQEQYGSTITYTRGGSEPYISKSVFVVKRPAPSIAIE